MNEIKVDHYFNEIAKESGYTPEEVSSVYKHYRRTVEQDFKKSTIIDLHKFGSFIFMPVAATNSWKNLTRLEIQMEKKEDKSEQDLSLEKLSKTLTEEIKSKLKKLSTYEKHKTVYQRFQEHTTNFRRDYELWLEEKLRGGDSKFEDTGLQRVSKKLKLR